MTLYDCMLAAADPLQAPGLSRFFKTGPGQYGEGDMFLGIKVPATRSVVKKCWRNTIPDNWQETGFPELERCIGSEYHEVRLAALLSLVEIFSHTKKTPALQQRCIDFYLTHTDRINNWDLVDLSCYPLLGEWLLKQQDRSILYDLASSGSTIWEQRIGIVSTMTFVRHGQLSDTFAIADILLHHPHDLIQKAVGWLLREAGKRNKAALEAFLLGAPDRATGNSRYRQMPRTGALIDDILHEVWIARHIETNFLICHEGSADANLFAKPLCRWQRSINEKAPQRGAISFLEQIGMGAC